MVGLLMFLQCILWFELLLTVFTGDDFLCLAVVDFQEPGTALLLLEDPDPEGGGDGEGEEC